MTNDDFVAEFACTKLALACYSLMDQGRYEASADLFADDATWVRGGTPVTGKPAILAALHKRSPDDLSRHLITNVVVTRTGPDTAEATACFAPYRGRRAEAGPAPLGELDMVGDLAYRFVRVAGEWRIAHLQPSPVFRK